MGRVLVLWVVAACGLLPCGCGGRAVTAGDGGAVVPGDGPVGHEGAIRLDGPAHDSCLPIPASQVQGKYQGTWKGTWRCPGVPVQTINGTLSFSLWPLSAQTFNVMGVMKGNVLSGVLLPFSTAIEGSMGCTALVAKLPNISVNTGVGMLVLTGWLKGGFNVTAGGKPSFPAGSWTAQQSGSQPCKASGSWSAAQ